MRSADSFVARTHDAGIGPGLGGSSTSIRCTRTGVGASVTGCFSLQPASNTVADKSDSSAGRLPKSVPTGRALSFPPRRSNDGKRDDTRHGRHDMWPLRAGTVSSIGESAAGRIATELLFSYRNDAQLVLTGIAKAQPHHGTAPPNSPWRASRQGLGWNKSKAAQDARQHQITSSVRWNSYEPIRRAPIKRIR